MVKEGYKETEIGVIPEDWNVKKINDIAIPKARIGWQNLRKEEYLTNGNYLLITGTDFSDGKIVLDKCYYVSEERYIQDKNIQVSNGAVLITKDGTLGKVALVDGLDKPATLNAGVFVLNNLNDNVDNRFLYQYLRTNALLKYATKTSTGGTIKHLNQNVLINFCVPYPSKEEQQKIAEALSDMDNLISSLEKLIEKKKAIKQACLQKMFPKEGESVPEMRLPGFTDAWEQRKLGDVVQITMGQSPDGSTYSDEPSDYILVQGNADLQNGWVCPRIWTTQITKKADAGDLIMSVRAPAGAMGKTAYNAVIGRGVAAIKGNDFIYQLLVKMDMDGFWKILSCGSTFESLNSDHIKNADVKVPTTAEQVQIGDFFRHLDNLITLHQRKLEKCKKIKKGMMQQLLTGKIRLTSDVNTAINETKSETVKVPPNGHNHQFDDAVVIAGIVDKFYSNRFYLGRKKVQKLLYLFRRHQEADTSAFKKKAAGPYADEVRYKGGEPIAKHRKYVSVKKSQQGSLFSKGENISEALKYISDWGLNDDFEWLLAQFKYIKTDRLELLATIDMAMCDLADAGKVVTVDNIKSLIQSHSEWKAKLTKNYFSDNDIAWAIQKCRNLFG